jgi:hypothetical protein
MDCPKTTCEFFDFPHQFRTMLCGITGEKISCAYTPIVLNIPTSNQELAGHEIQSAFEEREAMVTSHGAHGCVSSTMLAILLQRLRLAREDMLLALKSL